MPFPRCRYVPPRRFPRPGQPFSRPRSGHTEESLCNRLSWCAVCHCTGCEVVSGVKGRPALIRRRGFEKMSTCGSWSRVSSVSGRSPYPIRLENYRECNRTRRLFFAVTGAVPFSVNARCALGSNRCKTLLYLPHVDIFRNRDAF